jgi:catechol 2,3-dioxygenase-like lactoylglutathione lyase family enzyme
VFVEGVHHVATLTADLDRLIDFYRRVFDARVLFDREEADLPRPDHPGRRLRHAFIEVGEGVVLHPFESPGVEVPGEQSMFARGRLDHYAFTAPSLEAFREIRRRLLAEGAVATDNGLVTDMGSMWAFGFHDPDGAWAEIVWARPDATLSDTLAPDDWQMIDPG